MDDKTFDMYFDHNAEVISISSCYSGDIDRFHIIIKVSDLERVTYTKVSDNRKRIKFILKGIMNGTTIYYTANNEKVEYLKKFIKMYKK